MDKKLRVIIAGGSAAGTGRRKDSTASIPLLEKGEYISYGA